MNPLKLVPEVLIQSLTLNMVYKKLDGITRVKILDNSQVLQSDRNLA